MVAAVLKGIPETLPDTGSSEERGLGPTVRRMADLARDSVFMRIVAVQCLATAGFFVYIGGSSFVLETVYGLAPAAYATLFAVNALAMAASSALVRALVGRVGVAKLRAVGLALSCSSAVVLGCRGGRRGAGSAPPFWLVWCALTVVVGGYGFRHPRHDGDGAGGGAACARHRVRAAGRPRLPRRSGGDAADGAGRVPLPRADGPAHGRVLRRCGGDGAATGSHAPRNRAPEVRVHRPERWHTESALSCSRGCSDRVLGWRRGHMGLAVPRSERLVHRDVLAADS